MDEDVPAPRRLDRALSTVLLVLLAAVAIPMGPVGGGSRLGLDLGAVLSQVVATLPILILLVAQPVAVWLMLTRRRALPVAAGAVVAVSALVATGVVDWTRPIWELLG